MDMVPRRIDIDHHHAGEEVSASISALIERLTGLIRRRYRILLAGPAIAIVLGLLYLMAASPQYTATATLLIDSSTLRALQNQMQPQQGDIPLDTLQVGSQVEILDSRKVALTVVDNLKLTDDPEFIGTRSRFWCLYLCTRDTGSKEEREQKAIDEIMSRRVVSRNDKTYALNISYTARNPVTAAKVANAIADAYIDDQLDAKYQTITRAGTWLQDRINELKAKATSADRAVLEFKEKNNIVDFGGQNGASGGSSRLIGEQQLYDLNGQLATARADTSEAKARLDRIEQIRKMDVSEAAVSDILKNEVVTRLRNQYLDLSAREANLSAKYGADHGAAINVRNQMEELKRNISAELGRIAASYQNDYDIARTRENNLQKQLAGLVSEGQITNRDKLGLSELESSGKIYHSLYDSFLQRYMEAVQQQSFPITDARVISPAVPPSHKSRPVGSVILALASVMGFIASLGVAAFREVTDGVFRTGLQTEQILQMRCLSVIPLATTPTVSSLATRPSIVGESHSDSTLKDAPRYAFADPLKRRAVDDPASIFTEAFRAIKVAAWLKASVHDNKVIGITSTFPDEGKSTVACNLAALIADAGKRVVLVDADMRNPTLARSLAPRPTVGWMDVLNGKADLQQVIGIEPTTGLAFVPLALDDKPVHADEIFSSQAFRDLIEQLRQRYDYVIMDLPPIAPVVDVRAVAPLIDSFVFVVEWGSARIKAVQRYLMADPDLRSRLLGVVLNKADLKVLGRFEPPSIYQSSYYARSGQLM